MRILITYGDGSTEAVRVALEAGILSSGGLWLPGHAVSEPARCPMGSDYFSAAIDEGCLVSGEMEARDDGDSTPEPAFSWILEGTDEDECLSAMRRWIRVLGPGFDPAREGADYLEGNLLRILDDGASMAYDRDKACWDHVMDDPAAAADVLLSEAGFGRSTPTGP